MDDDLKPTLFDLPPIKRPEYEDGATLRQRWWAFHCANLHVYQHLRDMALDLKRQGYRKVGIALLWEQLRWRYFIQTRGDTFKLGNSYRAFYSRFLMVREPELAGFFDIRKQPSQEEST